MPHRGEAEWMTKKFSDWLDGCTSFLIDVSDGCGLAVVIFLGGLVSSKDQLQWPSNCQDSRLEIPFFTPSRRSRCSISAFW